MKLFIPITKIDEEKREVWGTATQEIADREDEIFDYDSSKPFFEKWSEYFAEATAGKSVGNLRAMHRPISAGKLTTIEFNDAEKKIDVVAKVVDDDEWEKCKEGVYTGFSVAGRVVRKWRDPSDPSKRRYTADPVETSLADFPCVPTAVFSLVKIGGAVEKRTFKKGATVIEYADPKAKRLALDTVPHVRFALAAWGFEKVRGTYDAKEQAAISRRIRSAARKLGIEVTEKAMLGGEFSKGLYEVSRLADLIQSLAWLQQSVDSEEEWEGDESTLPDKLRDDVKALTETLEAMTAEECSELLTHLGLGAEDFATTAEAAKLADLDDDAFQKRASKALQTKAKELHSTAKAVYKLMSEAHDSMGPVAKMLGEHCEKLAAFHGELSGTPEVATEKIARESTDPTDQPTTDAGEPMDPKDKAAADEAFAKLTARMDTFEKAIGDAKKETEDLKVKLAAAEAARDEAIALANEMDTELQKIVGGESAATKPVLHAVEKIEDVSAGGTTAKVAVVEAPKTARDAFKKSFENPQFDTLMPRRASA